MTLFLFLCRFRLGLILALSLLSMVLSSLLQYYWISTTLSSSGASSTLSLHFLHSYSTFCYFHRHLCHSSRYHYTTLHHTTIFDVIISLPNFLTLLFWVQFNWLSYRIFSRQVCVLRVEVRRLLRLSETMHDLQRLDAQLLKHIGEMEEFEAASKQDRWASLASLGLCCVVWCCVK